MNYPMSQLISLQVTEHKNREPRESTMVRVFVDDNVDYGLFIVETELFSLLTPEQQAQYRVKDDLQLKVTRAIAEKIIELGTTPYSKQKL